MFEEGVEKRIFKIYYRHYELKVILFGFTNILTMFKIYYLYFEF
jgi:hypothetical protein